MKTKFISILNSHLNEYTKNTFLEVSKNTNNDFGDYSMNLALKLSKELKKNPMIIAEEIKEKIKDLDFIESINISKPGFINFFIKKEFLLEEIKNFINDEYKPDFNIEKQNINYEFISANPTGDLHIGHLRNAVVGDIICNVFAYLGHDVTREYWINDYGNQMVTLSESIYFYLAPLLGLESDLDKESVGYHGKEIIEFAEYIAINNKNDFNNLTQKESIKKLEELGVKHFLNKIKKLVEELKIKPFDYWTSEKEMFESGKVKNAVKLLEEKDALYEKDGAKWLKTEVFGDDKDRVLMKEDGNFTYMTGDIANHIQKFERGFDVMFNLWGADHHGYEKRILASMEHLNNDPNKVITDFINMVQIENKGEKLKMSKRAGTSLRIKDVLENLSVDIARYFIISKTKEQSLSIDINEMQKDSQDNPYFYSQYTNARVNQLINKFKEEKGDPIILNSFKQIGQLEQEKTLILKLFEFGDAVIQSSKDREPFVLINYLKELSKTFNSFYNSCRVITDNDEISNERINVTLMTKGVFERIFDLLGIDSLERM